MPALDFRRLVRAAFSDGEKPDITLPENIVRLMLADARSASDRERRRWSEKLISAYYGDNIDDFLAYLETVFEKPREKQLLKTSFVRKFAWAKSSVFNQEPTFGVTVNGDADEDQTKLLNDIIESGRWFEALQQAGRLEKVVNTLHLLQRPANGTVFLDTLLPDATTIFQQVTEPWRASAIAFKLNDLALFDSPTADSIAPELWAFWSDEAHFLFVSDAGLEVPVVRQILDPSPDNPEHLNPYGRLPIVKVQNERPEAGQYWGALAVDVWLAEMAISAGLMAVEQGILEQGFSITWSQGFDKTLFVEGRGPGSHYNVEKLRQGEQAPSMGSLKLDADLDKMVEAVDSIAQRIAIDRGVAPAELSIRKAPESGFSKLVDLAPQMEERQGDIDRWTVYLRDSFELLKLVWPTVKNPRFTGSFTDDAALFVSFGEPKVFETPNERLERIERQIGMGLMSKTDALIEIDPDLDREQAAKVLERIETERAIANSSGLMAAAMRAPGTPSLAAAAAIEDQAAEDVEDEG